MARPRWFSPTTATIAIVVAAAIGGGLVWRAGGEVRARDLAAYRAWEERVLPTVDRAEELARTLPEGDLAVAEGAVASARAVLGSALSRPDVLRPTVAWFASAFEVSADAIDALRAGRRVEEELRAARERFETARENLRMLQARLRLRPLDDQG